jgi:WD40 repeat protein
VYAAVFNPDGTSVLTVVADTAYVWDVRSGQAVREARALQNQELVIAAAFSMDGTRVITASGSAAQVWDVRTSQSAPVPQTLQHRERVNASAFSPDGTRVVTASDDWTARVWDPRTGAAIGMALQHQNWVNAAAFSPDGTRVVTASDDKTARVWDARTGQEVTSLAHADRVLAAAFNPDGTRVVTASADGTARVRDAQVGMAEDSPKLADLAEVLGGLRLSAIGVLEPLVDRNERLAALRQQANGAEQGTPGAAAFMRWVLDDPWKRTTSPLSKMTVDEYIERMLGLGDAGRAEAERLFLGHPRLSRASQ